MKCEIKVVPTGAANLASVRACFQKLGCKLTEASSPQEILDADFLVLPGVGAFASAMTMLEERNFVASIRERIRNDLPFLGICLGLQLLAQESEESPGATGLGVLPVRVRQLQVGTGTLPHMGWNRVLPPPESRFLKEGDAYFAHSFCLAQAPAGWQQARTQHGEFFVAAVERGQCFALQFHPELSGSWGLSLLERWLCAA
jgi:imidazole glycerol phosphate synthase glutamine amidotransferase subunit